MKIGLIDVDGHNFQNLALMKLSAWHKQRGDTVEWCNRPAIRKKCPNFDDYKAKKTDERQINMEDE